MGLYSFFLSVGCLGYLALASICSVLLLISATLVYKQWSNDLVVDFNRRPFGWVGIWSSSVWTNLYDMYQLGAVGRHFSHI
jgi:hypothetical protein